MPYAKKLILCAVMLTAGNSAMGAELRVEITNADESKGVVYFALYDSAQAYEERVSHARAVSQKGTERPSAVFTDLPPGYYAVTVFQDTNGNSTFDTNMLGLPTEPYGFSRNAVGNMGRPDFSATAITPLAEETTVVEIELRNLP